MMKSYIRLLLSACLLMASLSASAQMHKEKRISPEEFRAKTEAFIGSKAGFTAEEAQKFFPIYHEMKGKQWKIMQEVGKLKQQKPGFTSTDKEYAAIVSEIKDLNVQIAQLEETYYKRMCKAVPAKKVFMAMQAEDDFHRQALSRFNHDRRRGK